MFTLFLKYDIIKNINLQKERTRFMTKVVMTAPVMHMQPAAVQGGRGVVRRGLKNTTFNRRNRLIYNLAGLG